MASGPPHSRTCQFCGNSYSKKEHFERHVRTHTQERPFQCERCSSRFSRKDTLRRHARSCQTAANAASTSHVAVSPSTNEFLLPPFDGSADGGASSSIITPLPSDFSIPSAPWVDFNWQWDDALNANEGFSFGDLCNLNVSAPEIDPALLGLRTATDHHTSTTNTPRVGTPQRTDPRWFTHLRPPGPSPATANPPGQTNTADNDEISRDELTSSLHRPMPHTNLPSTSFLNRCIQVYITRLWPVVPVVHLPSFQPARAHPLLVLSICSLGALADGSEEALCHAERLYEGVRRAVLVSSSSTNVATEEYLPALQAATIGQTFALLLGQATHFLTAHSFHGTLCVALRKYCGQVFGSEALLASKAQEAPSAENWNEWVHAQTVVRLQHTLYIHNGEISANLQQPAFLRINPKKIVAGAPDHVFLARTAEECVDLFRQHLQCQPITSSIGTSSAKLECLIAEVSHMRSAMFRHMDDQHVYECQKLLQTWIRESATTTRAGRSQQLGLLALWHSCFLALLTDIDALERTGGRDESTMSAEETHDLHTWSHSLHAKRSVVHAIRMCKLLDHFRISDVHSIYGARSFWHAGLVLAMYSSLASNDSDGEELDMSRFCPELQALQEIDVVTEIDQKVSSRDLSPKRCRVFAFTICTMLRQLGPWPVGASYKATLSQIVNNLDL